MSRERRLDVAQLHPEPTGLDHAVTAALEVDHPLGVDPAEVPGAVVAVPGAVGSCAQPGLRRLHRVVEIARGDRGAADQQFALARAGARYAVLAEDRHLRAPHRPADRHPEPGQRRGVDGRPGDDIGLHRAVEVGDHGLLWQSGDQFAQQRHVVLLPREEQLPQVGQAVLAEGGALHHGVQRGGHRVGRRDRAVPQEAVHGGRQQDGPLVHQMQAGSAGQRHEDVVDRQVEVQRRMLGDPVRGPERKGPPGPVHEVAGIAGTDHHALGRPGRARGVEDVREVELAEGGRTRCPVAARHRRTAVGAGHAERLRPGELMAGPVGHGPGRDQQQQRISVGEDLQSARQRRGGVDRHVRDPGEQAGEHQHHG